jgi:hypothetical protein
MSQVAENHREQRQKYMELLDEITQHIDGIDAGTMGDSEVEPGWWVQMMELRRLVAVQRSLSGRS